MKTTPMTTVRFLVLSLLFISTEAFSQSDAYIIGQQASLSIAPLYQSWSLKNDKDFAELGSTVFLYYPVGREWSFSLRAAPASASGDVTSLGGFTDTQIGLAYHIEKPDIVFTARVGLPTGKKELTQDEFETSILLSNSIFNLQAPNFGQGLNVNPGVVWAFPVSEDVVLGLGATYQYRGKFKPLQGYGDYDPGDELLVTGGIDMRTAEATTLSCEIDFTTYGRDTFEGEEVFASGNRVVANVQFSKFFGGDELRLLVRYRARGENRIGVGKLLVPEAAKVEPNQLELGSSYNMGLSEFVGVKFLFEARFYENKGTTLSGAKLFGFGVNPEVKLASNLALPASFIFRTGTLNGDKTITGVEAGLGIRFLF
jgi:hypothetical protein